MPELPEVQTVVDHLTKEGLIGRRIRTAKVYWPKTVDTLSAAEFCRNVRGQVVADLRRRGKFIVLGLENKTFLLVHLRMTGRFHLVPESTRRSSHVHVVLDLDDKRRLMFHDTRKFGRIYLTDDPQSILGKLGPEPLSRIFSARYLGRMLGHRKRQIKPLLLDQSFLAGMGNIYVDEALWRAAIHPLRRADTLSSAETTSLHRAIRHVLRQGIRNRGTSLGAGRGNFVSPDQRRGQNASLLKVFRQNGHPCPRCGNRIQRLVIAQRSSHVCEQCQRAKPPDVR